MPIFDNNGKKQNVQDAHIGKYMELYPDATTVMERDGKKYRVKAKDYNTFLGDTLQAPKMESAPQPAPQVEAEPQQGFFTGVKAQIADTAKQAMQKPRGGENGYTFTAEELGIAEGKGKVEAADKAMPSESVEAEPTSVTTATAEVAAPVELLYDGTKPVVPGMAKEGGIPGIDMKAYNANMAKAMAEGKVLSPQETQRRFEEREAEVAARLPQANAAMSQRMQRGQTVQGAFDRAYSDYRVNYPAIEAEELTSGLLDEYSKERASRQSQVEKDVENYSSARKWALNPYNYGNDAYGEARYRSGATKLRKADELDMMEEFAEDAKKRLLTDEALKAKAQENADMLGMTLEKYVDEVAVPILQNRMYSEWLSPQEEKAKKNYNGVIAAAEGSLIGTLFGASRTNTEKYLSQVGQEAWRKDASLFGRAAAGAGSMFLDLPAFMGAGLLASVPAKAVGGQVFKQLAKNETKRLVARGVAEGAAQRYANFAVRNGLKNRILLNLSTAPLQSGLTFGMFDAGKAALNMSLNGEWDWKELGKSAAGGTLMGGALGAAGAVGGGLSHGLTGATKAAAKVAEFGAENAVFTEGGRLIGKLHGQQPENGWLEDYVESGATLLMIKAPNIVKNVSAIKGDKEASEVFAFNRLEREQLGKYGNDLNAVLESLLPKSGRLYEDGLKINEGTFTEEYRRVMSDPEVSMTSKAKLMGIVEGKMMPAPRVVDAKIEGNRVMTYDPMGRLVEVKEYATEAKANAEYKKVANAAEVESIAVMEDMYMRIKGYEADDVTVREWLAKNPTVTAEDIANIIAKNSAGEKLTEGEQKILDSLRKARHEGLNDVRFLNDVLAELNDAGVDVKAVMSGIEKPIDERTEAENRAVKAYTNVLYQEIKAKVVEPFRRGEAQRAANNVKWANEDVKLLADRIYESDRSVDETANDGMVYTTTTPSAERIIITGGKVVLDNEGYIDVNQSEGLVAMFPDGQKKPVRPGDLREKVEVSNAEELKAAKREEIVESGTEGRRPEGPKANVKGENGKVEGEPTVAAGESVSQSGKLVPGAEIEVAFEGEIYKLKVDGRDERGDIILSGEGASMALPESVVLEGMKEAERFRNGEVKGENQIEVAPVVEGQKGENAEKVVEPVDEAAAPVVEAPKTALEQIPRNEKNVPLYEQVDSELAWDGVVEEAGGNEETAMIAVNCMIADKQDALKKAEKAKAKAGVTITEKIAAENERVANIERAKADLAKWEEIAGVKAKRALAAEAESKRVADEAAAKQRAEEERLRAEREEEEREEREALNGVPDMVDDKPQDARARGYRRVNGHKVDRQEPVQGLMGKEIAVKFSDSSIPTGRVAVIEAEQLQPSHIQGQRNPLHFIDEAQPKERNDAASVLSARKIAENVRPEEITSSVTAYTGAPTVNTRGEAVQGNNRSAALRLMWENNPEQAAKYKQYLIDHAAEFGLNAEEIAAMKSPVLVNMLDVSDADAITLGQYVAQDTESGGTERIKPKNVMQKMGGDMRSFANKLLASNNEEASFAELVDANGVEVLKWMAQKGYITPTQYKSAFDSKGNLTAEAKNDLRDVMYQSIFKGGSTQLEEMFNALPAKAQKAILATAFRDYDSPSGERMNGEVQNSIRAYYALARDAAFANAKNYKEAKEAAMMWARQYQLDDVSGESFLPSENFSNFAIELAIVYKGWTQRNLQNHFNNIYDLVQGTKVASLFEEADNTPRTLKEAIKETFNIDYNGQSNSNSLAIDSKDGQARKRGGNGDIATGERIEGGERPADSTGGARGNGEVSSPEIPNNQIPGLKGYTTDEVLNLTKGHITDILGGDISIVDMRVIGSRSNGTNSENSDLDVLVEFDGDISEDAFFNAVNGEDALYIDGVRVDINPITKDKSGTIEQWMNRNAGYSKTEGGNAPGQSGVPATLIKGAKWENTGEPDKIKSSRKKGDSHDITWYIGKKKYGSTTAERDLLVILAEDYGGDLNAVWNAYEQGEVLLGANEAAILKKLIETNTSAAELQQGVLELDRENPAFERATKVTMDAVERLKENGLDIEVVSQEEADAMAELAEAQNAEMQTSKEIEAKYPDWLEGTTTESGKHSTQVEGTRKTYKKVGDWIEENMGKDVAILDASSGMGYGTADLRERGFNIEDVEPYQSEDRKQNNPATYSSYADIEKQYDYIISNAVLNVVPDDWRTDVLHNMADKLKDGGKLFINTRKAGEERFIKDKIELDSPQEVLVKRNGRIASYQRFFTPQELKEWVESELGDGYTVEIANKANSGTNGLAAVVVTKNNESPANGKTSELGQPILKKKNAPLANVAAKVSKNAERASRLDAIISSIEKIGEMGPHEFLHEVVNAMLLSQDMSTKKSRYAKLGGGVTLRLANHYGNAETFKEHKDQTENYGLVIKLSNNPFKPDKDVDYLEYVYFPDKLTKERQIEIAKGLKAFMEMGRYDLLPKPDKVNHSGKFVGRTELSTTDGKVYGWAVDGKIRLTPDGINPNTPIHEYTHLWAAALQKSNPKLWNEVAEAMKLSPVWNEVMADENYSNIHGDENRVASEVLSRLSGNEGYRRYMEQAEKEIAAERDIVGKVQKKGILNRIKNAVSRFWNWLKGKFRGESGKVKGESDKVETWDVFVNKTLKDFDEGVNPDAKDSPLERMFMGKKGADNLDKAEEATTRLDNLNVAREMETAGKDAKAIKLATGWERGADRKWRYETEDEFKFDRGANIEWAKRNPERYKEYRRYRELLHKANYLGFDGLELPAEEKAEFEHLSVMWDGTQLHNSRTLKDYIDAPDLFEAYPELRDVKVKFETFEDGTLGKYNPKANTITLNEWMDEKGLKSTLNHEIQHAIQHIEGFARGGNISTVAPRVQTFREDVYPLHNMMLDTPEWAEKQRLLSRWLAEEDKAEPDRAYQMQLQERIDEIDSSGVLKGIENKQAELIKKYGYDRNVINIINEPYSEDAEIWDNLPGDFYDRYESYRRLAGEVESRNVEERMGMSPEERRNKLAEETEDVRREDQIFLEKNLGESASEAAEEDIPVESVQTQPMTFAEKITNSVLEASAKNKENLALRSDALRMFGRDVANVLKLMGKQREYDKSTVDQLVKLAKMYFKDAQLLGGLTPYQVGRVMTRLNNAVGKRDITDDANELVNILVDAHNKELEKMLEKQAKTKAKKVNASGVEVIGKLDKEGQLLLEEYNAGKELDLKSIDEKIIDLQNEAAEASGKLEGENGEVEREVAAKIRGLELARQYREEILAKQTEIKGLEQELKSAEQDATDGAMDRAAYKEFRRATERAILESKLEMVDAYHGLIHGLGGDISSSAKRAKLFQQQQIDHVKEIQHNANSDLLGHPAEAQGETPDKWNSSVPRLFMSAMPTFQTMLKFFGEKAADGRGYLYERFIPQHTQASHNEYVGKTEAREKMRDKLTEIFGKKTTIENFMDMSRKDGAVLEYQEGGQKKTIDLTRGQVLYLYMINKMADGQMKLSRMGIPDADVLKMAKELPEEMVRFADWVQEDFLTELREKYNKVHERMFGAPMAAIESYFPIKINKRSRGEKIEPGMNAEDKPSTVTGSVIKRTKNAVAIDLSADAMQVLLGHIDDMENWAAWAEFRRDLKSLLNYRHFQNQVKGMESLRYGSGEKLWKNFVDVANIAAGSFKPSSTAADRAVRNIAKGVVSSKIAFRYFTALKQILSTPAFWSEVDFGKMMNAYLHQKEAWDWAMKNLPGFSKRWEGRASGNEILLESDADWKVWQNRAVQWLSKEGMRANAFIDALTVATGAKAVFETKYKMFKKAGYSEERAREKALNRAAEAYNESQQSSESAYLSPLQAEATFVSSVLTAYRNSPFGYNRKMATAIANLKKKMKKGFKQESIDFMIKQLMRDGLNEEQAKKFAKSTYRRSVARDAADVALYEFFLNYVWVLGPSLIYILGGDDDEKKKELNVEALIDGAMGGLGNLPAGETLTGAIKAIAEGDVSNFKLPQAVAMQDMETIADLMQTDPVRAAGEVLNILVAMGVGVNPQTFTDMFVALADTEDWSDPREIAMLVLRLINAPNSKLELLEADEAMENYGANIEEITSEYAEYQKSKRAPLTGWLYSDESEQKAIERYEKRFKKILDERFEVVVENTDEYDMWYENSDPQMKAKLAKLRQKFLEGDKETTMEKLDSIDVTKKVLFGSGYDEVNTVYYELSTAEDEDMAMMIDAKLKELTPMMDEYKKLRGDERKAYREENLEQIQFYNRLNAHKNNVNNLKGAMKKKPEEAQEKMEKIRKIRTKAIDLINNYNE